MISANPLFPQNPADNTPDESNGPGFMPPKKMPRIEPFDQAGANAAADLIRAKLAGIYADEPNAQQEAAEVAATPHQSRHQKFMYDLSTSGKSLAEIQTAWHDYYVALPDHEKHQVWQEFYENNNRRPTSFFPTNPQPQAQPETPVAGNGIVVVEHAPIPLTQPERRIRPARHLPDVRDKAQIKTAILKRVNGGGKLQTKHHVQSILFGVGSGLIVMVIFLFGFFNEVVIAPFIQPSRTASATPIIVDPNSVTAGSTPQIIIPKINVQIPVDYSQSTINETDIENALENGIVHYPTTEMPGQTGNAAFFGHSSNNIFNKGKYKFAFVLLHELVPGDTFYITSSGKVYIYKVVSKTIVPPTQVDVLNDVPGHAATATLITCDPPGTSLNRLVVVGEQISPDPSGDTASSAASTAPVTPTTQQLPGNGPTLWTRMWRAIF